MIIDNAGTYTLRYTATDECGNSTMVDRELIVEEPWGRITWSDGTDEEIVAMVAAADRGEINLADYWNVGDERVVRLSAMSAMSPLTDTHVEQDATLVLMNAGGKTLNTPTQGGRTQCSFIVGLKNVLLESGRINSSNTNSGGWDACPRRTWCNTIFYNAIPSDIRPIFKEHLNKASNGGRNPTASIMSVDYFALPAEYEVFGEHIASSETYESDLVHFEWYKTMSNRGKKSGQSTSNSTWWERSPNVNSFYNFCCVSPTLESSSNTAPSLLYLSPFGVI